MHYFYDLSQMTASYPDFLPLCVDKPFILVTDILFHVFWVSVVFFRSLQHRAAQGYPCCPTALCMLSGGPGELCICSGCG